ncbi:MAG: hypothetical protein GX247_00040 [Mollicutes bacterium]|nr:hypothetical protein [Mollicutes bacterium]
MFEGKETSSYSCHEFNNALGFNSDGVAFASINHNDVVLHANGYCFSIKGLSKLVEMDDLFNRCDFVDDFGSGSYQKKISLRKT